MAKGMKKWIFGTVACAFLAATPAFAAPTEVYLNGDLLHTESEVLIQHNRTLMGFRDFFSATGLTVTWDEESRTAKTTMADQVILIRPDSGEVLINEESQVLDEAPQWRDDHIYLPLRFFSENLGYEVTFTQEDGRNIVSLQKNAAATVRPAEAWLTNANGGNEHMGYFIADGHLVALSWQSGQLKMERLAMTDGHLVQSQRFFIGGKESGIAEVFETAEGQAALTFHAQDMGDFLGSNVPRLKKPLMYLETSLGKLPLYETPAAAQPLIIDGRGMTKENAQQRGYAIDTATLSDGARESVALSGGNMLFLINDRLLLIDPKALTPLLLDRSTDATRLIADGDRAVAAGVKEGILQIDLITADGEHLHITPRLAAADELALLDMKRMEKGVCLLLRAGDESFVVTIGDNNESTATRIDGLFERLIPNLDDNSLYGFRIASGGEYVLSKKPLVAS